VIASKNTGRRGVPALRVGDVVEVRSAAEILATLDEKGEFENLPFMPEMLQFCGKRLTVHKVAHKLCDNLTATGLRWMDNAVHLTDARCDGQAHGGCQTGCSLYWKEAWLKRVTTRERPAANNAPPAPASHVVTSMLLQATRKAHAPDGTERFTCQATELLRAAPRRIRFFDFRQYVVDVRSGNVTLTEVVRTFLFGVFNAFQMRSKRVLPPCLQIKDGLFWGFVPAGTTTTTPTAHLDLQPGEFVRIKSKDDIVSTLNTKRLNRGMGFEEEMARACGKTVKVARRVNRCIEEKTGRLVELKNPCIVLDGVVCEGVYHGNCPREFVPFWREIWLERVQGTGSPVTAREG
jgi:hypothetical protein